MLYTLAINCGLQRARQLVVFGDGAAWIWRLAAEHFPEAVQIVVLPPIPPVPGAARSVPDIERDYFISNAARMRYPAFRAEAHACGQWHR